MQLVAVKIQTKSETEEEEKSIWKLTEKTLNFGAFVVLFCI